MSPSALAEDAVGKLRKRNLSGWSWSTVRR